MIGIGVGVPTISVLGSAVQSARPNLLLWSEQFDNAVWVKTGTTVLADQINDPNAELTVDLVDSNDILAARIDQTPVLSISDGQIYTFSIYFQAGPDSLGGAGTLTLFDDIDVINEILLESSITPTLTRVSVSGAVNVGATQLTCRIRPDSDDGKSLYLWGAKLELGGNMTDYVKREGV